MIQIIDKHNCCGCEACVQVCPKHCINFTPDNEGFSYPQVDELLCINCGLCENVCPVLHPYDERTPQKTYAAINKDDEMRMSSSSGGIFTLLAEKTIDDGGVVFGARFEDQWQVVIDVAETKEAVKAFRGSKYLQARVGDSFLRCKQYLELGRKVLFTGTPCQISALHHFLRKDYDNLLAVDFICHGVPSPLIWHRYLVEVVTVGRSAINDIQFRSKSLGWKLFSFCLDYNKDSQLVTMSSSFKENLYMKAFLKNLILRPSCHSCPAKSGKSCSDITIADFWGIEQVNPDMDDDRGTSLVLVNSEKGARALPLDLMKFTEENFSAAIASNSAWHKPVPAHHRREEFFQHLSAGKSILKQIAYAMRPTMRQQLSILKHPRKLLQTLLASLSGGGGQI